MGEKISFADILVLIILYHMIINKSTVIKNIYQELRIRYICVLTEHQETARQQEIMCGYQVDRIFSEKISGANKDRPQLKAMLAYVREGDTLYIESISRLGRSTKDLLNIIETLNEKGVNFISHKEKIDTDSPTGKFVLTVFAALSQLERKQLKQRQH